MKGIIFTEFLGLVEDKFGIEIVDNKISRPNLESEIVYISRETYRFFETLQPLKYLIISAEIILEKINKDVTMVRYIINKNQ
jgi:hypothetical protein